MDRITIIMPFRNALPYLKDCLDSILLQTYSNWELIAVDDHSTDLSPRLVSDYASKDNRISCIKNSGLGIIDALNCGYSMMQGAFVTRMDADDIMPPNKLTILHEILIDVGSGSLSTGKVKYISEGQLGNGFKKYEEWLNQLCENNTHYQEIYKECVIPSPCWMMYKNDFDSIGAFDSQTYPEDYDLCFRMYENQIKIKSSKEILHIWRDHGERASRNDENYSDNRFIDLKVKYFLRNDLQMDKKLVVWGAGKKGKQIAKLLIDNNVEFDWVTNNPKKIDKHIYDKIISNKDIIIDKNEMSFIIAIANSEEQMQVIEEINSLTSNSVLFKFC